MGIEYIDEIADAMVEVCVRDFVAKPIDDDGDLLWAYFRQRLLEAVREVKDEVRSRQTDVMREIEKSFNSGSIDDIIEKKQQRREMAAELMAGQETEQ